MKTYTIPADALQVADETGGEEEADFLERFSSKFLSLWPWLILSIATCAALSFCYLKVASPAYKINASVLVQDDKKGTDLGEAGILQDFGLLLGKSNVDNEAEIFKSRTLMAQVVKELQLNVAYFIPGRLRKTEFFEDRPVEVKLLDWPVRKGFRQQEYQLVPDKLNNRYSVQAADGEQTYTGRIGDTLRLRSGRLVLSKAAGWDSWQDHSPLIVTVASPDAVIRQYMAALSIEIPNKQVSVINLTLNEKVPEKGVLILNTLIREYMNASLEDKSRMADSTVTFIDERLRLVFGELSIIEKDIENFKTNNQLTDLQEQSKLLLRGSNENLQEQTSLEVQLSVIESLESFLTNNQNDRRVVPSSLVMQDPNFIALVKQYNELQLHRDRKLMNETPDNPAVQNMDIQLFNLRQNLISSIGSIKKGLQVSISELRKRSYGFASQISSVPKKERQFLDYSRQQEIKQELYLFLLKKREEMAISKSSTLANARIIDSAEADPGPFKPKKGFILLLGVLAGLLLPFLISYLKDFLSTRVTSAEEVTAITKVPLLAEIGHHPGECIVAVQAGVRTIIAEQFRSLRTNLQYLLAHENAKVILVTSSMSGEGKSFLSVNLGITLSLASKKVILLELDLRKPQITHHLGLQKAGFTNYILARDPDCSGWIQASGVHENLDILSAGSLPPNPSELLLLPRVQQLISDLKNNYDYIIIDTAPIGLVTDAYILASHADVTLYIVRQKLTGKQQIKSLDKLFHKNFIARLNIVLNDVQPKKSMNGYGYAYYGEKLKPRLKKPLFSERKIIPAGKDM